MASLVRSRPSWRWSQVQRVAERGLRQWRFAVLGCGLGVAGTVLFHGQEMEDHALAQAALLQLQSTQPKRGDVSAHHSALPFAPNLQRRLAAWPLAADPTQVWVDLQQVLESQGLRLLTLRPLPTNDKSGRADVLTSQAVAVRLEGGFGDWRRTWAALTRAAAGCSIERLQVLVSGPLQEVQIDAVLRVWWRPVAGSQAGNPEQGHGHGTGLSPVGAGWLAMVTAEPEATNPASAPLFEAVPQTVPHVVDDAAAPLALATVQIGDALVAAATPKRDANGGPPAPSDAASPLGDDPRQWPLSSLRLLGLWQQDGQKHAILSAGAHWAKAVPGQRVTLEGHRVAGLTEEGVLLRLGPAPPHLLTWADTPATGQAQQGRGP